MHSENILNFLNDNLFVSSFENALQGRMAGVNVAESTGEPGASPQITIRGTGSISAGILLYM